MGSNAEFPRHVTSLVVVESDGKAATLEPALRRAGMGDFYILVCGDLLLKFPSTVPPIGLDADLEVAERGVVSEQHVRVLRSWAAKAKRVYVASDVSERGDLLAADARGLLASHPHVARIRLRALHFDGVVTAFSRPEPILPRNSWPSLMRDAVDRCVRYVANRRLGMRGGAIDVGLVDVALARLAASAAPGGARMVLSLPAADNAGAFTASFAVEAQDRGEVSRLASLAAEAYERDVRVAPGESAHADQQVPWNYEDAICELVGATEWSARQVHDAMYRLYEAGKLSFPAAAGRGLSSAALTSLGRIADDNGFRFDPTLVEPYVRGGPHEHEALHPVSDKVDITTPIAVLRIDDAVLSLITRHLLACGQPHVHQKADASTLPSWAAHLRFERRASLWLSPVQQRRQSSRVHAADPMLVLLELLRRHRVGSPGQIALIGERFAATGFVDGSGDISGRARALLSVLPPQTGDVDLLQSAEKFIAAVHAEDRFGDACRELLASLGLLPEILPILSASSAQAAGR